MPTYEPHEGYLIQALDSVIAQTMSEWTLYIHDDASTKDVHAIIEPYLKDARITFKRSEKRLGIAGNWNACLKQGSAPFIQYLFQDDMWKPEYLQKSIDALNADETVSFTAAQHRYMDEAGKEVEGVYQNIAKQRSELMPGKTDGHTFLMQWLEQGLHPNLIGEPSFVMMRRSIIDHIGLFNARLPQCLDSEYWTRLLMHGNWHWLPQELGAFRVHSQGTSAQNEQSGAGILDRFLVLDQLTHTLQNTDDRANAKRVLKREAALMVSKFFDRKKSGKASGAKTGMKVPIRLYPLLFKTMIQYLLRNTSDKRVGELG